MGYHRPVDIARKLNISTSAMRHYESWGIIPLPERSKSNYRLYTDVHLAYFRCTRALSNGFGFACTVDVLRKMTQGQTSEALWVVNAEQAKLNHEKSVTEQTLTLLRDPDLSPIEDKKLRAHMTIGEAASLTDVTPSAIRHWEQEGLIKPERSPDNGYRLFTPMHIRQILIIRTMRPTVYFLEDMKEIVHSVERHSMDDAQKVTERTLHRLDERNRLQYVGVRELVNLCEIVGAWRVGE